MKEFEQWWKKYTDETGYGAVGVGHDAWIAALEWVLSLGDNEEPYTWENILSYQIRKELEENETKLP